jgi:hypothetical protein
VFLLDADLNVKSSNYPDLKLNACKNKQLFSESNFLKVLFHGSDISNTENKELHLFLNLHIFIISLPHCYC